MQHERHIVLEGTSNLRDIGGYRTMDGRETRWGLIYRSAAMAKLGGEAWEWMTAAGIRTVCDLRTDDEREFAPTLWRGGEHTRHYRHPYGADTLFPERDLGQQAGANEMTDSLYLLFPKLLAPAFREIFRALLNEDVPIIVHCSAGQDRTGLAIGLVLTALGVPLDRILEDYMLSTQYRRVVNEIDRDALFRLRDTNRFARYYAEMLEERGEAAYKPRKLVNAKGDALLLNAFAAIEGEWGSLQTYLSSELGIGEPEIERLRQICLQG